MLLMNGTDSTSDELTLVSQAAPGPHRKCRGQSTEVDFLAGPASLVVFFIILKPVKEGSGVLTQICLISSIECSEDSKQRNKYEGFHRVTLKNTLLESWGEEGCVASGVSLDF